MAMTPSVLRFTRALDREMPRVFFSAAIIASFLLVGCTNFCLVAISNPGGGTVGVSTGNPPPSCSLNALNGMVRVVSLKSPPCEACTAAARVEHVFVTLRGIQVHPSALADSDSPDWIDLVPALKSEPRQIDLMGGEIPEILGENVAIPAGNYQQVRLQFVAQDSAAGAVQEPSAGSACGTTRSNCAVMADGRVAPLFFSSQEPELRITGDRLTENPVVVLPDARIDLRLRVQANEAIYSSLPEHGDLRTELVGTAASVPQPLPE